MWRGYSPPPGIDSPEHRKKLTPKALPRFRPRELSQPGSKWFDLRQRGKTFRQAQSLLITRLPPEVRRMIWERVVGGQLLHIQRIPHGLIAICCGEHRGSQLVTYWHECYYVARMHQYHRTHPDEQEGNIDVDLPARIADFIPLLQSCRKVYAEAIDLAYNANLFDFGHVDVLLSLRLSVLPQRLAQIRAINFQWPFPNSKAGNPYDFRGKIPYDIDTWKEACAVLASMVNLKELTLHLGIQNDPIPLVGNTAWREALGSLKLLRVSRRFDVRVPYTEEECTEAASEDNYPFRLLPHIKFAPPPSLLRRREIRFDGWVRLE